MKKLFITLVSLFSITAATLAATITPPLPQVTFNTLADMVAYPYPYNLTNAAITLNGYYAISDGGGGKFVVQTNIATTNYGTYFKSGGTAGWYYNRLIENGDGVSVKAFGAVGNGTTDDTVRLQQAINWSVTNGVVPLIFPSGTYKITSTLNMATDITSYTNHNGSYWVGKGNYGLTIISGHTGDTPMVDASGTRDWICENIQFKYGYNNLSTIGVIGLGAQSTSGSFCGHWRWKNVTINVLSSNTANGGRGTFAFLPLMHEESTFDNCEFWANTPVAGSVQNVLYDWFPTNTTAWTITSAFVPVDTAWSATKNTFLTCRFISWDHIGPCFFMNGLDVLKLDNCYFSQRLSGTVGVSVPTNSVGIWVNGPCRENYYRGLGEGIGNALKIRGALRESDVRLLLANSTVSTNLFITNHLIDLSPSVWGPATANGGEIRDSSVRITSDGTYRPAFLSHTNATDETAPGPECTIGSTFQFNQIMTNFSAKLLYPSRDSTWGWSNQVYTIGHGAIDVPGVSLDGAHGQIKSSWSVLMGTTATTTAISNLIGSIILPSPATNNVGSDVNAGTASLHVEGILHAGGPADTEIANANFFADLSIASKVGATTYEVGTGSRVYRSVKATTYSTIGFVDDPTTNIYGVVNGNQIDVYLNIAMNGSSTGVKVRATMDWTLDWDGWYKEAPYVVAP